MVCYAQLQDHPTEGGASPPIPPQTDALFESPEHTQNEEEKSAYEDANWESLVQSKWFWGYMNRGDTEKKLYTEGKMGDFIIRLNSNQQLVMSVW